MSENVRVWINEEERHVPAGLHVASLLGFIGLPANRIAIERNRDILPRSEWEQTEVAEGDRFEIVHLVGGGSRRLGRELS